MKTEAQLLSPSAVKVEEIDPLEGQEELGIFQTLDKLEEVTEALLPKLIILFKTFDYIFRSFLCSFEHLANRITVKKKIFYRIRPAWVNIQPLNESKPAILPSIIKG